jgi:hypothetical protein
LIVAFRIAGYKKPKFVDFVPTLPKTQDRSTGKRLKTNLEKGGRAAA